MPTNRLTDVYGGRFARDASGSSVLAGYQQAVARIDTASIRRNLATYKKYGLTQSLNTIKGESDQVRYNQAAKAVVAKWKAEHKVTKPTVKKKTTVVKRKPVVHKPVVHKPVVHKPVVKPKPPKKKTTVKYGPSGRGHANPPPKKPAPKPAPKASPPPVNRSGQF